MARKQTAVKKIESAKKSRPNIHAKTKSSKLKSSKNYFKKYKGQGRQIMSEDKEYQMIYHYYAKIGWKKKRGNGYINHYKKVEFISRADSLEQMNTSAEFIMQIMHSNGLTGSKISDFRVIEIIKRQEISNSFYYRKENN